MQIDEQGPLRPSLRQRTKGSLARHPFRLDSFVAICLAGLSVLSLLLNFSVNGQLEGRMKVGTPVAIGICVATQVSGAWRRRFPVSVLFFVSVMFVSFSWFQIPENIVSAVSFFLAFYSVGVHGGRFRTAIRALSIVGSFVAGFLIAFDGRPDEFEGSVLLLVLFSLLLNAMFYGAAWFLGDAVRISNARRRSLEERTWQLEQSRLREAETAVRDERVRIARELHDVVAHHVSVMGIQAGAARLRASDEAGVVKSLGEIETSSRLAVLELERLMRLLRADGAKPVLDALPHLGRIPDLVEQVQTAGMSVDLRVTGNARRLSDAVELSGYRIVQEALTNSLKHGGPTNAVVRLHYDAATLAIEVEDEGSPPQHSAPGLPGTGGNGIIGMRERVTMLGGEFAADRRRGGGFLVRAVLPLAVWPSVEGSSR